jgi:Flp pilus assembly pilin Flp
MGRLWWGEEGQGLAEYGWTLVLVAIVVVLVLAALGLIVRTHWQQIADAWDSVWFAVGH